MWDSGIRMHTFWIHIGDLAAISAHLGSSLSGQFPHVYSQVRNACLVGAYSDNAGVTLMTRFPDKSVPLGCVAMTLGVLFTTFSVLALYCSHIAFSKVPPDARTGKTLMLHGWICLVPAVLMLAWGAWRILSRLNVRERDRNRFGRSLTD